MNLDKLYKMQEELDNHILINHFKRNVKDFEIIIQEFWIKEM